MRFSADEWLARLYSGDFGGDPDVPKAKTYFERAMQNADPTGQVPIAYGSSPKPAAAKVRPAKPASATDVARKRGFMVISGDTQEPGAQGRLGQTRQGVRPRSGVCGAAPARHWQTAH